MEPIAQANIRFAKSRLKHGLHCGDGGKQVGPCEGQFERAVPTAGDASDDSDVAELVRRVKVGNEVRGEEGFPANGSGRVLQIVIKAGGGRDDNHERNGAISPPSVKLRLEIQQRIARAAGAQEKNAEGQRFLAARFEDRVGHGRG